MKNGKTKCYYKQTFEKETHILFNKEVLFFVLTISLSDRAKVSVAAEDAMVEELMEELQLVLQEDDVTDTYLCKSAFEVQPPSSEFRTYLLNAPECFLTCLA